MDLERVQYINFLMEDLNESITSIYELLMDREFDELHDVLDDLVYQLNELKESIDDE